MSQQGKVERNVGVSQRLVRVESELLGSTDRPVLRQAGFCVNMPTTRLLEFGVSSECVEGYIQAIFQLPKAYWELQIQYDELDEIYHLKLVDSENERDYLRIVLDREDVEKLVRLCRAVLDTTDGLNMSRVETYSEWPEPGSNVAEQDA